MSNNRNLGNIATAITNATSGQVLTSQGSGVATFADAAGGSSVTTVTNVSGASDSLTAISSPSVGDIVFVTSTNGLFIRKSNGWFKIADVTNLQPTNLTGVSDSALAIDGTATTITLAATDPEGLALTFSAAAKTGSSTTFSAALTDGNTVNALNGSTVIATVAQASNVFTITPNTASNSGTVDITFSVTDGINTALTDDGQFTLTFVTIVTDSNHTTLLATATGTSDNNNITDSSSNSHSITVTGDAYAGTFSPYRSGGYSLGFTGNSYITFSNSSTFELTGDFCIDGFWYLPTTNSGTIFELGQYQNGILFGPDQYDNGIYVNGSKLTGLASSVTVKTWQHFAIVRKGSGSNNLKLYVDGTKVAESTVTANINSNYGSYTNIRIGSATHTYGSGSDLDDGSYIRDLRIVKGDSVYPSSSDSVPPNSITVPTEKSTAITGTILLAGALPYLADASTTDSTFTTTNTVSTKPFSPYDHEEYDAADNGGSVYFDGTGDYLQLSSVLPEGAFTASCWAYFNTSTNDAVFSQGTSGNSRRTRLVNVGSYLGFYIGSTSVQSSSGSIVPKTWYYIEVQYNGSQIELFINGTSVGTTSNTSNPQNTNFHVGSLGSSWSTSNDLDGYVSDLKVVSGTPSGSSTVPTSPLSSSGASLHIKGTDASIIDKSQGANLKLVGNTTGSTTQVKFSNTKSMYFDGTGDYITIDADKIPDLGAEDWTIETWFYTSNLSADFWILSQGANGSNLPSSWFKVKSNGGAHMLTYSGGNLVINLHTTAGEVTANTWHHIALTHEYNGSNGGTWRVYIDGSKASVVIGNDTYTSGYYWNSAGITGEHWEIAKDVSDTSNISPAHYLQDLRITKGKARYTAADESANIPSAPLEG